MKRLEGGYLGARPSWTATAHSGIWTPEQRIARRRSQVWPLLDPYKSDVALLLHMDGANNSTTFTDNGVNGFTVSRTGDTKISTDKSVFSGSSAYFDGSGDLLTVSSTSVFNFSSTPNTFECWLYPTAFPSSGNYCRVWMFGSNGVSSSFIPFQFGDTGVVQSGAPASGYAGLTASSGLTLNAWNHLALVQNGASSKLFLSGTLVASGTVTSPTSASNDMKIGYDTVSTVNYNYKGYIDEMRITKNQARYSANFSVPTDPFPNP